MATITHARALSSSRAAGNHIEGQSGLQRLDKRVADCGILHNIYYVKSQIYSTVHHACGGWRPASQQETRYSTIMFALRSASNPESHSGRQWYESQRSAGISSSAAIDQNAIMTFRTNSWAYRTRNAPFRRQQARQCRFDVHLCLCATSPVVHFRMSRSTSRAKPTRRQSVRHLQTDS